MDNLKFGAFLAQQRKEKGMTQRELADRLHVTDKAVSKWETGKGFPDVKLMEPLAEVLEVSLVELLRGERQERDTMTVEEAGSVAVRAMEQSERSAVRKYLRLLRWLLTGIGGLCGLPFILNWADDMRMWLFMIRYDVSIIGSADGPTAILTTTRGWSEWLHPLMLLLVLSVCIVLSVRVRRLEKKLK